MYYTDNSGLQHESFSAACEYYGADTPEQIAEEAKWQDGEGWIEYQDEMEARGGPALPEVRFHSDWLAVSPVTGVADDDEIPF